MRTKLKKEKSRTLFHGLKKKSRKIAPKNAD